MGASVAESISPNLKDCIAALWVGDEPRACRGRPREPAAPSSGYRNVYHARTTPAGADVWRARVKIGQRLVTLPGSRTTDVRACALAVARWYAATFGPNWMTLARSNARRRNPWKVWYSRMYRGYLAWVWVKGRPVELRPLTKGPRPRPRVRAGPTVFATAEAARAAIWPWVRQQYGERARSVVYISEVA